MLSLDLKELKLSNERIKTGRLFQSLRAETAKARYPCIGLKVEIDGIKT